MNIEVSTKFEFDTPEEWDEFIKENPAFKPQGTVVFSHHNCDPKEDFKVKMRQSMEALFDHFTK